MADEEKPALNGFQSAAQEMSDYMDQYDKIATTGGKIAHEESEKAETQAAAAPPADPGQTTEGPTPLDTQTPAEPATDDPWQKLAEETGKWKDGAEAKKGYFHAVNLAKNALAERDALKAQLEGRSTPTPSAFAPQTTPEVDALKALEDYGVPSELIGRAIDQRAQQTLMAIMAPMATQFQVDQQLAAEHPEWAANRAEVDLFLNSNPALRAQYESVKRMGTPEAVRTAEEFAFYKFRDSRAATTEETLKANHEVRKQIVDEARKDAGIVGAKRTEGHEQDSKPKQGLTTERFEKLKENARSGYTAPLWRETIGAGLPDELFGI